MKRMEVKIGDKFGRWTIVDGVDSTGLNRKVLCKCSCNKTPVTSVYLNSLRHGLSVSCGCFHKEAVSSHGMARTKIYGTWHAMMDRCRRHKLYKNRVTVCKRWLKFENFFKDMGYAPQGKSLDRIDPSGNYEPKNCRWATPLQQARNKRKPCIQIKYNGKEMPVLDWSKEFKIPTITIYRRLKRGLSMKEIFSKKRVQRKVIHT